MNKILKYTLIVVMVLSLLINVLSFSSIAYIDSEWQHTFNQKDVEWCEFTNDLMDYSNDLLNNLQEYDEEYLEIDNFNTIECWATGTKEGIR